MGTEDCLNRHDLELVPKKIRPYFEITRQNKDGDNGIIEGVLTCCNARDFKVFAVGEIKHRLFSRMFLYPENGKIVFEVRCKKCGKVISVINSRTDGYGQCGKSFPDIDVSTQLIECVKCRSENFSVMIKYEYPDVQELQELEVTDIENAFTWIWITLKCNKCGTGYKNFIDCETD